MNAFNDLVRQNSRTYENVNAFTAGRDTARVRHLRKHIKQKTRRSLRRTAASACEYDDTAAASPPCRSLPRIWQGIPRAWVAAAARAA